MDAPKCRLCGAHHYPREPHSFESKAAGKPSPRKTDGLRVSPTGLQCAECKAKDQTIAELRERLAKIEGKPFDRQQYQREYMRAYRKRKRDGS